jgi:tetratricopeptide (TPR) repeat protein
MSFTRNQIVGAIVLVVIIGLGIYFLLPHAVGTSPIATSTGQIVFDPNATSSQIITTPNGSYTVTPVVDSGTPAPDYKKPIAFNASVSAEVRAALNAQLAQTQAVLAKSPTDFAALINLGTLHKIGGDYTNASIYWAYAHAIFPKSTVPLDNLGGLHMDFIKDYAKAEAEFKASIALDPADTNAYRQLVSLYTLYGYKTKADAVALVQQGLKANPNNETLLQLQSQLQAQ